MKFFSKAKIASAMAVIQGLYGVKAERRTIQPMTVVNANGKKVKQIGITINENGVITGVRRGADQKLRALKDMQIVGVGKQYNVKGNEQQIANHLKAALDSGEEIKLNCVAVKSQSQPGTKKRQGVAPGGSSSAMKNVLDHGAGKVDTETPSSRGQAKSSTVGDIIRNTAWITGGAGTPTPNRRNKASGSRPQDMWGGFLQPVEQTQITPSHRRPVSSSQKRPESVHRRVHVAVLATRYAARPTNTTVNNIW